MIHPRVSCDQFLEETVPFNSAQEAWFWFIDAQAALQDGAQIRAGSTLNPRPCEASDILALLNRLYRNRQLKWGHIKILHHYGVRKMPPDPHRPKESRAAIIWEDALAILEDKLIAKGIVMPPPISSPASSPLMHTPYQEARP